VTAEYTHTVAIKKSVFCISNIHEFSVITALLHSQKTLNTIFMHHVTTSEMIYWLSCNATSSGFTWPSSGQTSLMKIAVFMNAVLS
jgi:hypothetical protein